MANNFVEIHSNWQFVLPPSRPSVHELERIRTFLINIERKIPVAVLGSTIEFRNLLHSMGFENIYIFEKNPSFYKWTASWITHKADTEYFIEGDWLDTIKQYKSYFAVILSDLTMGNISYDNRDLFYTAIYESLRPYGVFIDKVLTHNMPHIPLDILMAQYETFPINLESINRFSCEILFCSTLLNEGIINTTNFYNILKKHYTTPTLTKYIEKAHLITPENCIWYYGKFWEELHSNYFKPYSDIQIYEDIPGSPYYKRLKHFINIK